MTQCPTVNTVDDIERKFRDLFSMVGLNKTTKTSPVTACFSVGNRIRHTWKTNHRTAMYKILLSAGNTKPLSQQLYKFLSTSNHYHLHLIVKHQYPCCHLGSVPFTPTCRDSAGSSARGISQ